MKIIADIRFFESLRENIDGYFPKHIGDIYHVNKIELLNATKRFVLKLRERNFTLPNFDHIYINITPLLEDKSNQLAKRSLDKYHPFYRFADVGCSVKEFNELPGHKKTELILKLAAKILKDLFVEDNDSISIINECIDYVLNEGENAAIVYKRSGNDKFEAQILTRILSDGTFLPQIKVVDSTGNLTREFYFDKSMSQDEFIFQFASIKIGKNFITIKPKNNAMSNIYNFTHLKYRII